ncbi:MAG: hypothetical protein JHC35_04020 [Sulfuricurvum sp.]|jgi:hypothetical protein|uniref:hypothetical protein n=1 Tax=Sulfuricurvum sp. TaxID=2025608 RepID=UPI0025F09BD6|nr:hypothetical protein [Sulfuricurvum sp.]MCI4406441.1 hypothetical protein [Sulfuricurvum sp.]
MWLTELKTALVLEDSKAISELLDEMPQFDTIAQMEEASYLLMQVKTFIEREKAQTAHTLQQIKNNINFLKSTQTETPSSLNLKF